MGSPDHLHGRTVFMPAGCMRASSATATLPCMSGDYFKTTPC
ncbi:hypothetical protein SXCC_01552 [Gluconacetobacter sp. SXCC-1]|nr:hypothetical protein SXCC_01552 [Gluconacetobacter sp. SXCC-1]